MPFNRRWEKLRNSHTDFFISLFKIISVQLANSLYRISSICRRQRDVVCVIQMHLWEIYVEKVSKTYLYFNIHIQDYDKPWIPNNISKCCSEYLRHWVNRKRRHLKFDVSMIWKEPKNHIDDCYFCVVKLHGTNPKKTYSDLMAVKRQCLTHHIFHFRIFKIYQN